MRIHPIPPLQCLVFFDAAARHGNFTRAAEELNVTQGAVSKQVVKLESFLGMQLFVRDAKALHLTRAGQAYADRIHDMLVCCSEATALVMKEPTPHSITIACAAGTASMFLTPIIAEFSREFPSVAVRILVREGVFNLNPAEFDIGVYYIRDAPPPGMSGIRVIEEEVHAYCAPDYLGRRRVLPHELMSSTLLVAEEQQRQWMSWRDWFHLCDSEITYKPLRTITANSYPVLLQLAVRGHGVLLGWNQMITPLVESNDLVLASDASASFGGAYQLVWPDDRRDTAAVARFREWLLKRMPRKR
ncbi:LysR substrate-binding domain-containing protein [Burkholderia ubonensis]|uniref:LysR family transcriptional regulator n=1 Tax=Burkholderia ubonensis subsp. mesacidophila TaxID=265293 RepID=A0A2A4FDS1_9BURK|nr:LysR substrate-binding domain-containing protein [Burkholderia ubonensis]PCE30489.1 LysR family transcriptional regulator [Burkholderia ubonensis subsp. mesacidophila]